MIEVPERKTERAGEEKYLSSDGWGFYKSKWKSMDPQTQEAQWASGSGISTVNISANK